ncbi:unnamed protein product [Staurois parvus]|uniref:Uncharacterized protein n=1 Tax=Staurois parvus TaxID=386267 RepID=A0ABN9DXR7_9NEOB|nr:unnamed protein product [Staurois parvus]
MLRACGLVWFRRGGAHSSPSFLTCQAASSDKGLVWILGGTPRRFFFFFTP